MKCFPKKNVLLFYIYPAPSFMKCNFLIQTVSTVTAQVIIPFKFNTRCTFLSQVWSCCNCFGIFHIQCIQRWARQSIGIEKISSEDSRKEDSFFWCWYEL